MAAGRPCPGILQSGLTLIGEIQISRTGKDQVVGAFEVLDLTSVYNARNGSTVWSSSRMPCL
jgi:hypothetical protein